MKIRLEKLQDYREVENLTRKAFWNVYRPGCTEHYVLNQYRTNPDFIPELDFVMEEDGKIIGHVMFSKAEITLSPSGETEGGRFPSWTFGPISIHPDYKRKGYGLKLLQYALEKAKETGIGLLQMEGNIEFYRHAGFDLASKMKIHYHSEPRESEVPYFLALELIPGYWGNREGTYCPPKGYFVADENPEAFEAYEASFPAKERALQPGQLPQFCRSCGMPLTKNEDCGTNADGSTNYDYCQYCYKDGQFRSVVFDSKAISF
ncbi:MAG: GNAT family N-acetyltransferase [Bacteroidales bacterium]|nr:GNAT family N-acetyltransferase [Bacteroidales bacterium]